MKLRYGPSGIHLSDRESGWNILFDEVVPAQELWSLAPRHVSIALTNTCDLKCKFCYAPKKRAHLDLKMIQDCLSEIDANGAVGVGFGGGEPTLYPHFVELCNYAAEHTNLAVSFTSHGHHLNNVLLSALKQKVHFIRISMDGVGKTYERLRNRPFVQLEARLLAVEKIAPFGINYVVNEETILELDNAIDFAIKVGASEFLLLPEQPVSGKGGIQSKTLSTLQSWMQSYNGKLRLSVSETSSEDMLTCNPFNNECGLHAYAHIDAHGILKRSSYALNGIILKPLGFMAALDKLRKTVN